ncbi:MAG: hypothetical protein L7T25_06520, partial [Gammaproteobacteria bacterium]|nr:hypothetical protein [Gammaproteobacteria bacterium]
MQKKIFIISLLLLSFGLTNDLDAQISQDNQIALQFADVSEFKALRLKGSETNLEISEIKNVDRNVKIEKQLRKAMQRKSDYFISLQNDDGNVIYQYGIGNPFVIHLQHSGFEDEIARVINDNAEIMIYYPSKLNPASISL